MTRMKADLHMHGPIGFQPYWLRVQGYYKGENLLKEIADVCFERDIGICAITSHENEIPRGSVHDRFNWLKEHHAATLPEDYEFDTLGKNIAIIEHEEKGRLYLVNGQTALPEQFGKRYHYLVVGTNEIPNHKSLEDTVKEVHEREDCFGGPEHGFCEKHGGFGEDLMYKLSEHFDFGEGFNSQLILPFGNHGRGSNKRAQELFEFLGKSWIATSDAHRIEDAGISYIEFDKELIDASDGDRFIRHLRQVVKSKKFENHCQYEKLIHWLNWVRKFQWGIKFGKF